MTSPTNLAVKRRTDARLDTALAILKQKFGERLSTAEAVRNQHGKGEDHFPVLPPDAVIFAESTEDVAEAVRVCAEHKVPVIPFGTGTSLEGHIGAIEGGISLDVSRMNQVLEVNAEDLDCRVQAGVTRKALNEYL
ncbi:MAG: FAD-binding oxidoreductase, partial [Alphaproteobacteria bacterium]